MKMQLYFGIVRQRGIVFSIFFFAKCILSLLEFHCNTWCICGVMVSVLASGFVDYGFELEVVTPKKDYEIPKIKSM